jgi:hypothetical protein
MLFSHADVLACACAAENGSVVGIRRQFHSCTLQDPVMSKFDHTVFHTLVLLKSVWNTHTGNKSCGNERDSRTNVIFNIMNAKSFVSRLGKPGIQLRSASGLIDR